MATKQPTPEEYFILEDGPDVIVAKVIPLNGEARGRNGWFRPAEAEVYTIDDETVVLDVRSKRPVSPGPVHLRTSPARMRELGQAMIDETDSRPYRISYDYSKEELEERIGRSLTDDEAELLVDKMADTIPEVAGFQDLWSIVADTWLPDGD